MKTKLIKLFILSLALIAGNSQAAIISVMNGDHDVINGTISGHLGLSGLGHTSTLFADSSAGWTSALASGADAIVIEQSGEDGANAAALNSYMSAGGRVIMLGGSGNSLFNSLFGSSTSFAFLGADLEPFAKQAAATGTTFADDAATLVGLSSHHEAVSGMPAGATTYYGGAGNDIVFGLDVGLGDFFYLGWDYCCGGSTAQANDWYGVLDSAINFEAVPEPSIIFLFGLGLLGLGFSRRKNV